MNILAIDQAKLSGWAFENDVVLLTGNASTYRDRLEVITELGCDPCLVVFEDHSGMRMLGRRKAGVKGKTYDTSAATLLGMGRAHGWWDALLDSIGHDPRARIKCPPQAWKGMCGNANAAREVALANAIKFARLQGVLSPAEDEAVAVCMLAWANNAPEARAAYERAYGSNARKRRTA